MRELRNSKKPSDDDRIYTSGEKEYLAFIERSKTGIPLNKEVQTSLVSVRNELDIDFVFSWE